MREPRMTVTVTGDGPETPIAGDFDAALWANTDPAAPDEARRRELITNALNTYARQLDDHADQLQHDLSRVTDPTLAEFTRQEVARTRSEAAWLRTVPVEGL